MRMLTTGPVDKAVEYILAQPDGMFPRSHKTTSTLIPFSSLDIAMCIIGVRTGMILRYGVNDAWPLIAIRGS